MTKIVSLMPLLGVHVRMSADFRTCINCAQLFLQPERRAAQLGAIARMAAGQRRTQERPPAREDPSEEDTDLQEGVEEREYVEMDEDEGEAFDAPSPSCDQPEDHLEEFLDCWCGQSLSMNASEANMDVTPKRLLDSSWSSTETAGLTPGSSSSALTPAENLKTQVSIALT